MKKIRIIGIFAVLLFVYFIFDEIKSIKSTEIHSWKKSHTADCAIVLTGGSGRISEGISLLNQNRVEKVIISGVNPTSSLQQIFPALPFYGNVDSNDIILEKRSKTTYGNARQSMAIIGALNCQSVILITSRIHIRRALKVFKKHLHEGVSILPRAIYSKKEEENLKIFASEVIKSFFYNIWAY